MWEREIKDSLVCHGRSANGGREIKDSLFVDAHPVRGQGGWVGRNAVPIIHVDEEINVFGQAQRKQEGVPKGRWCRVLLATQAKC